MTSLRHNTYLDAARESILDVGWRRTTLTDVARRAGVSRMTIYRTWPDMQTLLADLMTREWGSLFDHAASAADAVGSEPTPERLASGMLEVIAALRANPLFQRILDVDPELLLPYLLDRRGRSQQAILDFLTDRIRTGQDAGTIRAGSTDALARTVLLAAHGFALSAHTMVDEATSDEELAEEFTALITRGLTP